VGKRLFIAADIDVSTREQIGRISMAVREAMGQTHASWVRPDRMHLTLQFFGGADAALEERVRAAMARPIAEAPFDLSFGGIGFFPERGSPRVLWLGVADGLTRLRRLHAALSERNFSPTLPELAKQPFTPHLTLARLRERVPRTKFAGIADIPASAGPSRIDRVTLYESRLSPAGPRYIPLAEALLHP
jgi:2'-5' RNA ligase